MWCAGPVPAPRVPRSAHPPRLAAHCVRCGGSPGAPALRERPAAPCHPHTVRLDIAHSRRVGFVKRKGVSNNAVDKFPNPKIATGRRGRVCGVWVAWEAGCGQADNRPRRSRGVLTQRSGPVGGHATRLPGQDPHPARRRDPGKKKPGHPRGAGSARAVGRTGRRAGRPGPNEGS